jgi:hypothetical protein
MADSLVTPDPMDDAVRPAVSVVFPCLNEREAIGGCVDAALAMFERNGLTGEVVVVDNGSTDGSAEIAREHGARVIAEEVRGYGAACRRGLLEARGEYAVMLDADGTYPVELVPEVVALMRSTGADMSVGNRFSGRMERAAMPLLNRVLGNPVLSAMTRFLFGVKLKDIHCGMRGVRTARVRELDLRMPGMEFATEMIVKALDRGFEVVEFPIPYRARVGPSKLNPLRDAWRHIEYMLVFSPTLAFILPGALLLLLGLQVQLLLLAGPLEIAFRVWDFHTSIAGMAAALAGATTFSLGVVAATYARSIGMEFRHSKVAHWAATSGERWARIGGTVASAIGTAMWLGVILYWVSTSMGTLAAVPFLSLATSLFVAGLELVSASFVVNAMMQRSGAA